METSFNCLGLNELQMIGKLFIFSVEFPIYSVVFIGGTSYFVYILKQQIVGNEKIHYIAEYLKFAHKHFKFPNVMDFFSPK